MTDQPDTSPTSGGYEAVRNPQPICGDPTCKSWACTSAALNAWHAQQQVNARAAVRESLGLPVAPEVDWAERYRTDCPDDCIARPDGHVEGCPIHCGCFA